MAHITFELIPSPNKILTTIDLQDARDILRLSPISLLESIYSNGGRFPLRHLGKNSNLGAIQITEIRNS